MSGPNVRGHAVFFAHQDRVLSKKTLRNNIERPPIWPDKTGKLARDPLSGTSCDHFCRKYQSPANDLFVLNELSRLVFQEVWIVHDASLGREVPRLPQHLSTRFLKKKKRKLSSPSFPVLPDQISGLSMLFRNVQPLELRLSFGALNGTRERLATVSLLL